MATAAAAAATSDSVRSAAQVMTAVVQATTSSDGGGGPLDAPPPSAAGEGKDVAVLGGGINLVLIAPSILSALFCTFALVTLVVYYAQRAGCRGCGAGGAAGGAGAGGGHRRPPQTALFFRAPMAWAGLLSSIASLINAFGPYNDATGPTSAWCLVEAWLCAFGELSMILWWSMYAVQQLYVLSREPNGGFRFPWEERWLKWVHLGVWGMASLLTIVPGSIGALGFRSDGNGQVWGWVVEGHVEWEWINFYAWLLFLNYPLSLYGSIVLFRQLSSGNAAPAAGGLNAPNGKPVAAPVAVPNGNGNGNANPNVVVININVQVNGHPNANGNGNANGQVQAQAARARRQWRAHLALALKNYLTIGCLLIVFLPDTCVWLYEYNGAVSDEGGSLFAAVMWKLDGVVAGCMLIATPECQSVLTRWRVALCGAPPSPPPPPPGGGQPPRGGARLSAPNMMSPTASTNGGSRNGSRSGGSAGSGAVRSARPGKKPPRAGTNPAGTTKELVRSPVSGGAPARPLMASPASPSGGGGGGGDGNGSASPSASPTATPTGAPGSAAQRFHFHMPSAASAAASRDSKEAAAGDAAAITSSFAIKIDPPQPTATAVTPSVPTAAAVADSAPAPTAPAAATPSADASAVSDVSAPAGAAADGVDAKEKLSQNPSSSVDLSAVSITLTAAAPSASPPDDNAIELVSTPSLVPAPTPTSSSPPPLPAPVSSASPSAVEPSPSVTAPLSATAPVSPLEVHAAADAAPAAAAEAAVSAVSAAATAAAVEPASASLETDDVAPPPPPAGSEL